MPQVTSINVNPAGGVPKRAVPEARLGREGVEGDRQRNLKYHGGPERAVCLYSAERIEALRAEGHPIVPGSAGENLTVRGLDWSSVAPGDCLRVGGAGGPLLQVTSYTAPCGNIAGSFAGREFRRIDQDLHPGWSRLYARVIEEGVARVGDAVELVRAPQPADGRF